MNMNGTARMSAREDGEDTAPQEDHPSRMLERFNWIAELVARKMFAHVVVNEAAVDKIRELSSRGTVVFAMRHRSLVDYFLVNSVLRREGLPLPVFVNGVSATLLAPFARIVARLRAVIRARTEGRSDGGVMEGHDYCARAAAEGRPILVFMRGRRSRGVFSQWLVRPESTRVGIDYLREIVHGSITGRREVFIVPMALFRGHSFHKREPGRSALVYSVQAVPSDARKLLTYLWNRRDMFITVGKEVEVSDFMRRYPDDPEDRLVKRLARAVQIFLHREERVVLGPALLPRRQVRSLVLENSEMDLAMRKLAEERDVSVNKLRKEAEGYFDEMAADFNGVLFGFVAWVFKRIWNRMFSGIEPIGFEKVIEKVRDHPVVLVPCHRSHFDYLIITYLCHLYFVSPPHIFAGINMAFWPMAPLLRASGAFFVRRSFADNPLYKLVFRQYLMFLIREGYTQEFFIEGGRSRTGKIMTPRLGMLSAIVNAHLGGIRRDLYLCPVSIHYGRILEEDVYQRELSGAEKDPESFSGLLRARRFLNQKYGTVYLSFADPISLNEALGDKKQRFTEGTDVPEIEEEKRKFIQRLGFRILRAVNACSVAGASSVSATVMLGASRGGRLYSDYAEQANALAGLVRFQRIRPTASLERNIGSFRESLGFLSTNGLIDISRRADEEILVVPENKRLALDFYKNNLIHAFLVPSLLTYCLVAHKPKEQWCDEIWWWLDLFRYEFALPTRSELASYVDRLEGYYRERGAIQDSQVDADHCLIRATLNILDNFREAYWIAARSLRAHIGAEGVGEKRLLELYRKDYGASLLLGEVVKSEGATVVLLQNALNRYSELGLVRFEASGRGGRERKVMRGTAYERLDEIVAALAHAVVTARASSDPPALRERATTAARSAKRPEVSVRLGGVDDGAV